ncbi:MAG TPA: histidine kinase dimerization/phospho-acceptor domain-containing protein, partial [Agriterribacter sp.]|nr:histidine kinase dimerization/phospho-acceptor domain-containing protein [Agriterribacter sp.]
MKNLLQKSLKQLTIFAFIVFALSIPSYFLLVDWIWLNELDENNYHIAERIENEFNDQNISNEKLAENIKFWNEIQPVSKIDYVQQPLQNDSMYTILRQNPYSTIKDIDRFRGLKTNITINGQNYTLVVETNVEETGETVGYIALVTLLFFLILVVGFWILNRRLSRKLWQPFHNTLQKLKSFQLNNQKQIQFQDTDTIEFAELNATLDKLLQHSIVIYRNQKEFTENASHELQTPLAILKNKLDILLQSDDLTERQYHIAEEMNKALIRSSRINKNLLLLAKIENSQFDSSGVIRFDILLLQSMDGLQEHFKEKDISVGTDIDPGV